MTTLYQLVHHLVGGLIVDSATAGPTGQGLPRTGSDDTTVMIGLGLLVLGAGLGFTAISLSRRRHIV